LGKRRSSFEKKPWVVESLKGIGLEEFARKILE
jgi:hypothetical protein